MHFLITSSFSGCYGTTLHPDYAKINVRVFVSFLFFFLFVLFLLQGFIFLGSFIVFISVLFLFLSVLCFVTLLNSIQLFPIFICSTSDSWFDSVDDANLSTSSNNKNLLFWYVSLLLVNISVKLGNYLNTFIKSKDVNTKYDMPILYLKQPKFINIVILLLPSLFGRTIW